MRLREVIPNLFIKPIFIGRFYIPGPLSGGRELAVNGTWPLPCRGLPCVEKTDIKRISPRVTVSLWGQGRRRKICRTESKEALNPEYGRAGEGLSEKVTIKLRPRVETLE